VGGGEEEEEVQEVLLICFHPSIRLLWQYNATFVYCEELQGLVGGISDSFVLALLVCVCKSIRK
jgi:hypothetical protein